MRKLYTKIPEMQEILKMRNNRPPEQRSRMIGTEDKVSDPFGSKSETGQSVCPFCPNTRTQEENGPKCLSPLAQKQNDGK